MDLSQLTAEIKRLDAELKALKGRPDPAFVIDSGGQTALLPFASDTNIYYMTYPGPRVGEKLLFWAQAFYVQSSNDASNYWTITLYELQATTSNVITSFTTAGLSPGTHYRNTLTPNYVMTASAVELMVRAARTLGPGSLYCMNPILHFG